jgi:hypothetical protein
MWKMMAELYGWNIPEREMERLAPVIEALRERTTKALDRDLSTVDPVMVFRPDRLLNSRPES